MYSYINGINFINKEECNKLFTVDKAIEIILYKLLMEGQKDKVILNKKDKTINVVLDNKYICQVKYEEVKDENIIKEYRKEKIKLKVAELIKR